MATPQNWAKSTVVQLKEELTKRGLETPGKKAELVERLMNYEKGMSRQYTTNIIDTPLHHTVTSQADIWTSHFIVGMYMSKS